MSKRALKLVYMTSKAVNTEDVTLSQLAQKWRNPTKLSLQSIVEILREAIISGFFKAGEPLRQDIIAAELGKSKIPVREALRQLEAEGLVNFLTNRGAIVSKMSLLEMTEMFELRSLLECQAIELAIPNLTTENFARAEEIIEETELEADAVQWGKLNWQFHSALYLSANRPYMLSTLKKIHTNSDRYVRLQLSLGKSHNRSQSEHREILEACKQGDIHRAKQLTIDHLELAKTLLTCYLKEVF